MVAWLIPAPAVSACRQVVRRDRVGGRVGTDAAGREVRLFSAKQARELWTAQTPMRTGEPNSKLAGTKANFAAYGLGALVHRGLDA